MPGVFGQALAANIDAWQSPLSVSWTGSTLGDALHRLAEMQQVHVLLDRRVDPATPLDLTAEELPARDVIALAAEGAHLCVSFVGQLAYIGPTDPGEKLATLAALRADEARRRPQPQARRLLQRRTWGWQDFATPRGLIDELAREANVEIAGLEQVPHDLWSGARLPSMTWVERLTIVAVQFDLTFEISVDGKQVVLVAVPERVAIERSYPGGPNPEERITDWQSRAPRAEFRVNGSKIIVRGTVEEHSSLAANSQSRTASTPPAEGTRVYTLTIEATPLDKVLEQLADKLQLQLSIDEMAIRDRGLRMDQLVKLAVKQVPLEELFAQLLEPTGLAFRIEDKTLHILPRATPGSTP